MKQFHVLTLFPELLKAFQSYSIINQAISKQLVSINIVNMRDYAINQAHQVDDYPAGGGVGMVLMAPVVVAAIKAHQTQKSHIVLLSPQGKVWTNELAYQWAQKQTDIILVCGHYEGIDERVLDYVDEEISIGDYVLSGGELASMVIMDSVIRVTDGVIKTESHLQESFNNNLLDYAVYTKPNVFAEKTIPEVLLSGNHKLIDEWRAYSALYNTYTKRPDLIDESKLTKEQLTILQTIKNRLK